MTQHTDYIAYHWIHMNRVFTQVKDSMWLWGKDIPEEVEFKKAIRRKVAQRCLEK